MKVWYPYKQMSKADQVPTVVGGQGSIIFLENGKSVIDGISSWWAVIHGYNHPALNDALIGQITHFSHVMLGGLTHDPAKKLAEALCKITPEGLNHVFFSDSGSIGVEVALKMAIQFWKNNGIDGKNKIISLKDGYHGDTFKAMEVSDDSDFTSAFGEVLQRGFFLTVPKGGYEADKAIVEMELTKLEELLQSHSREIACFILEPILQGAGGMKIYAPLYLKGARELCSRYDVLLIFDEVATGFGRTGKMFAAEHAGVCPDIMILGKALTAGYMGHAATLATSRVFNAFLGDSQENALMHGPTFMGNPLACTVALRSIDLFQQENYLSKIKAINTIIEHEFSFIQSTNIYEKRIIGAMGAIEMKEENALEGFTAFAVEHGVWLRPIGKVLYLMPPYIIEKDELVAIIHVMKLWIERLNKSM